MKLPFFVGQNWLNTGTWLALDDIAKVTDITQTFLVRS